MSVAVQASFDDLGTPLREVTFVVVDLETTGGSPADSAITEIGAVKVRGGEPLGEFATLVNPCRTIPPFIAVLTGITDSMVAAAPAVGTVLPAFLEFAAGSVLVAHNAPFDLGFLRAACEQTGRPWPGFAAVDTARLARRVLTRDESPDCRLATLATVFRSPCRPTHRALDDARATVTVLHGLLERVGGLGVQSLEELARFTREVSPAQAAKRHLADGLPDGPGVYLFRDGAGRPLYVGKSRHLRSRVRNYFLAGEPRTRMAEMVALAERVDAVGCAHELEAEVRELRLIASHKPPYNRRSKFPERAVWVKLTAEAFPRLSLVRSVRQDAAHYLGPFGSARAAADAVDALQDALPLRRCTRRLRPGGDSGPACALAGIGRCGAPCVGAESAEEYAAHAAAARAALGGDVERVVAVARERMAAMAAAGRYEQAATTRDRLLAYLGAVARWQRLSALAGVPLLVAAAPAAAGGWELAVVRHGRLAAAGTSPPGTPARPYVDALVRTAETVRPGPGATPCASAEEMEAVLRWLARPGTRLVAVEGTWACPVPAAAVALRRLPDPAAGRAPFAPRPRRGRPEHRPARQWGPAGPGPPGRRRGTIGTASTVEECR